MTVPIVREPPPSTDALTRAVIGAAMEVHRHLGPGFLESVYEEALCVELQLRGVPFERQKIVRVAYKGVVVGDARLDLLIGDQVVVELKAVRAFAAIDRAKVLSYLKATGRTVALLINFQVPVLKDGLQRLVFS